MRILFALHGYKPAHRIGGPIISVSSLAETLVRKGHQVTVFTTNSNLDQNLDVPTNQPIDVDGVEVWYFHREEYARRWLKFSPYWAKSMGFLFCPEMPEQLDRLVPAMDLVHTHLPFIYPTFAAARAAKKHGKPLFYNQRGVFDPARLQFRALKKYLYILAVERPILKQATTLIALTPAEVESYRRLKVDTPCRIIPNGIEASAYPQVPRTRTFPQWNITDQSQVILFLGRVHPVKGAARLLEAFLRIQNSIPRAVLVLAGPDEFGLERQFKERVDREGLRHRVVFPGMVSGADKLDLLARCDLFCLPSDAEGFSMAVLEALASGTPVILSPGCHFPEVETAGAGRVTDPAPQPLGETLRELLSRPETLAGMGLRAVKLVRDFYQWDRIADQMLAAYEEGIARHRRRKVDAT
ncbi:MAG: glycosyltransferase [Nitrospinaceae bacterium]